MNHIRKLFHVVLLGLILLLFIMPTLASAETDTVILCIEKYQTEKGLSYDAAKKLCAESQNQTPVVTSVQRTTTQTPVQTPRTAVEDDCIKKYMDVYNLTYEDAKAKCYPVSMPTPYASPAQDPVIECIAKYQKDKGLGYDEAKKLCTAASTTQEPAYAVLPQTPQVVKKSCGDIEKTISHMNEKLKLSQGQNAESIKEYIEQLKKELKSCETNDRGVNKEATPEIKNPCDEVKILKENQEYLAKKIAYIKELIAKGEKKETDLEPYYKEANNLQERLEKMNFACQQGKPLEESPCVRLSKLEINYREINDKIQGVHDEKSRAELNEKLAYVVREITTLKQKCNAGSLGVERVESLSDVEKAYRTKQKEVFESTSEKDLQAELAKIEESKKKLLEEFGQRMQELDARHTTIVKKLEIKGGDVYIDDIKSKATRVKVNVKEKDIEIEPIDGGMAIKDGDIQVQGAIPLEYTEGAIKSSRSGKEIKIMPSELKNKTLKGINLTDIQLIDEGKPEYLAKSEKRGKLLGFIPTTVRREYRISAESGNITSTSAPWWSAIAVES